MMKITHERASIYQNVTVALHTLIVVHDGARSKDVLFEWTRYGFQFVGDVED